MKVLLLAAALTAPAPFDAEQTITEWRAANWTCESEQTHDGEPAEMRQIKEACVSLGVLTANLMNHGYCYDAARYEWAVCE